MLKLTPTQYERLPELARSIVDVDHQIEASRDALCCPVLTIGLVTAMAANLRRRRDLVAQADRRWGRKASTPTAANS